jgi:hypothetical protein
MFTKTLLAYLVTIIRGIPVCIDGFMGLTSLPGITMAGTPLEKMRTGMY